MSLILTPIESPSATCRTHIMSCTVSELSRSRLLVKIIAFDRVPLTNSPGLNPQTETDITLWYGVKCIRRYLERFGRRSSVWQTTRRTDGL